MKRLIGVVLALPLAATAGNFCAVTSMGSNCNYPTLQSCQQALAGIGGQCVVNPASLPSPYSPPAPVTPAIQTIQATGPAQTSILGMMQHIQGQGDAGSIAGQMQRGFAEGQRLQQERQEHEARMRLLETQAAAARGQSPVVTPQTTSDSLNRIDAFARACRTAVAVTEETSTPTDLLGAATQVGVCYGLIAGVVDLHSMLESLGQLKPYYCLPPDVSRLQMAKVVVRQADALPELGHMPPGSVVIAALRNAWPCPGSG